MDSYYRATETVELGFDDIAMFGVEYGTLSERHYSQPILGEQTIANIAQSEKMMLDSEMFQPGDILMRVDVRERLRWEKDGRVMDTLGRAIRRHFVISHVIDQEATLYTVNVVAHNPIVFLSPAVRKTLHSLPPDELDENGFRLLRRAVEASF